MSWILELCLFVVYIYSAGYVELPIVLLYLFWCLVYHMLSKIRRNSRSLHRVTAYICYIYFYVWCITCCWGISAMFAGSGVRFHSSCIFYTVVVVAGVTFIQGFFRCRGYCVYLSRVYTAIYVLLIMSSYLFFFTRYLLRCLVHHMSSKMRRSSRIYI